MRNSISFKTCLKFSNSVCDLLIVSLQTPSLIIILVYRPPSCPVKDFEEISLKIHTYVMALPSPLPNIILLGDFNLPEINWSSLNPSCPTADLRHGRQSERSLTTPQLQNHLVWSLLTKLHTNCSSTAEERCQLSPSVLNYPN